MSGADTSTDQTTIDRPDKQRFQECQSVAKTILGSGFAITPAEHQGPLSYTFIGTPIVPKYVISFRLEAGGGRFDPNILQLAKAIHGDHLVPDAALCGYLPKGSDSDKFQGQSLVIYKMSYLPGRDFWSLASQEEQLDKQEAVKKRTMLIKSLARYYARTYQHPQPTPGGLLAAIQAAGKARGRIKLVRRFLPGIRAALDEITEAIPFLFGPLWAEVLAHGDLSGGNVLLDENTWEITGILGWSAASGSGVQPFGVDLRALFLAGGRSREEERGGDGGGDGEGEVDSWWEHPAHLEFEEAFWAEFFDAAKLLPVEPSDDDDKQRENEERRERFRKHAGLMGRYSTIERFAFERFDSAKGVGDVGEDGKPLPPPYLKGNAKLLLAWFGNGDDYIEGGEEDDEDEDEDDDDEADNEPLKPVTAAARAAASRAHRARYTDLVGLLKQRRAARQNK